MYLLSTVVLFSFTRAYETRLPLTNLNSNVCCTALYVALYAAALYTALYVVLLRFIIWREKTTKEKSLISLLSTF